MSSSNEKNYRPETRLVHAGTLRSQYNEMSEALFLTQGYKYESAEDCELRFSGKIPGYVYSRYSNPTMDMFEQRMAALEGAEAARSTATGMAAVIVRPGGLKTAPATGTAVLTEDTTVCGAIHRADVASLVVAATLSDKANGKVLSAVDRAQLFNAPNLVVFST